jgi:hypothetical protein
MPDISIGGIGGVDPDARIDSSVLLANMLQLDPNLNVKLANALEAAISQIIQEKIADAKADALDDNNRADDPDNDQSPANATDNTPTPTDPRLSDPDPGIGNQPTNDANTTVPGSKAVIATNTELKTDRDRTVETAADSLQAAQQLQNRAAERVDQFRDELAHRAPDLSFLRPSELVTFARSLLSDDLAATWEVKQQALEQQAAEAQDALTRVAEQMRGQWPEAKVNECIRQISGLTSNIDAVEAGRAAAAFLTNSLEASVSQLVARATDPSLAQEKQREAKFDAHLAIAYAEALLKEQATEACQAASAFLEQLPPRSLARTNAEAMLAIADRFPESQPETRKALEWYYTSLSKDSAPEARKELDRLLMCKDDAVLGRAIGYAIELAREGSADLSQLRCIAKVVDPDPEVRFRARQQLEETGCEVQRAKRVSPFEGVPDPKSFEAALLETAAFQALQAELVCKPAEVVAQHAEARLTTAFTVLSLIETLKEQDVVKPEASVNIGGAFFQLDKGSRVNDTEAAHQLAGQVYLGSERLDTLLTDTQLASLARVQAALTTVVPSYVNGVDSAWERNGMRNAFENAVAYLIKEPAGDPRALERAYEIFRAEATNALKAVYESNRADLERLEAQRFSTNATQTILEADLTRKQDALAIYKAMLAQTDAQHAYYRMQDWMHFALYEADKR